MNGLIWLIFIAIIIILLFFTKTGRRLRMRASGTADEIITKDASTPEGAKAYYNKAIEAKEQDYQKASAIHAQMLGKIENYEDQLRSLKKENMQLDLNINSCVDKDDDEGAKVYLKRQQEVIDKIEIIKDALKELKEKDYTSYRLRKDKLIGESQIQKIRKGEIASKETLNTICKLLQCQPGDILEYVEDEQ